MHRNLSRRTLLGASAAAWLGGTAHAALLERLTPLPAPVTLTVGAATVAHLSPLTLMEDDLRAMGVTVKRVDFVRYADARTALAAGSLDLATVGAGRRADRGQPGHHDAGGPDGRRVAG